MLDLTKSFSFAVPIEKLKSDLKKSNAVCYVAGTGCGKSYWVKNTLAKEGTVLFLTSRITKVYEDTQKPQNEDEQEFKDDFCAPYYNLVTTMRLASELKKILYMRDEKSLKRNLKNFLDRYDYIVIDEVHALACDSTFQQNLFIVQKFIEYAAFIENKPVIALTATIEPIEKYLNEFKVDQKGWYIEKLKNTEFTIPKLTSIYEKEKTEECLKTCINQGKKFVYFANFPSRVRKIYEYCINLGVPKENIAVAMSDNALKKFEDSRNNQNLELDDIEKINSDAIDMLRMKSCLPDHIQILITTSRLREGVNIKNKDFNVVVCESHYLSDIIQYMGRVRKKATLFFVIANIRSHNVISNKTEYDYLSKKYVTEACNKHLHSLENWIDKNKFIKFITQTSRYIGYDLITQNFYSKDILFDFEQQLIASHSTWYKDLKQFILNFSGCGFNDAYIREYIEAQQNAKKYINSILGKEIFGKEEKNKIFDSFETAYGFKRRQPAKLKEFFLIHPELNYTMDLEIRGKGTNRDKIGFVIKKFDPNDLDWLKEFE